MLDNVAAARLTEDLRAMEDLKHRQVASELPSSNATSAAGASDRDAVRLDAHWHRGTRARRWRHQRTAGCRLNLTARVVVSDSWLRAGPGRLATVPRLRLPFRNLYRHS